MVDGLNGLRHHGVVGCNDDDGKVGELGTSGTHCGKGFVARGVEEGNAPSVREFHIVGTYVLGDASGLSRNDVGLAYVVEQRGLAVVNVTHHGDDRRPRLEVFRLVHLFAVADLLGDVGSHELHVVSELLGHEHKGLGIETLVDGYHQTEAHTSSDDLHHRGVVHQGCEVVDRNELGDLQGLLLCSSYRELLLGPLG